jgi:GTP-binding protein YchF
MKLSIGIVGMPNVGKSTLFNALLKKQVANVANYPFCTIDPNVGVIEVPDERLPVIAKIVNTEKIVPAVVEFYDIAGLVKGASEGAGLGNKFLSHIREVSAIVHVVRLFEDDNIIHVDNKIDPISDIKTIDMELILADLATLNKQPEPRMNSTKEERYAFTVINKVIIGLNKGITLRNQNLIPEETDALKQLNLLTIKPTFYAFNVSEIQLEKIEETDKIIKSTLTKLSDKSSYLPFCAKLENDVLAFNDNEQKEYLKQFNLFEVGLNRLIKQAYKSLNLISFLTGGTIEAKAWTITRGTLAPQAAGTIHTDFEKNFIRADIVPYDLFVSYNGWVNARENGKVQTVGRDYEMKDGDVVEFKIGT